jgi:2-keto-3-deoxy-L-rhamnonate aldolase RhmA
MRENRLRAALEGTGATIGTHLFLDSPTVVETVAQTGSLDYVEFLAEYASYDLTSLENFCRAAELHDVGTLIKVDYESHRYWAQRAVGAGFEGVLFADGRSADDVRGFVASVRPNTPSAGGSYGAATRRHARPAYGGGPTYVRALNDIVVGVMIEKREAVEALDEILAVPGIDFVQWGPADYAMSTGIPGQVLHSAVTSAELRVLDACRAADIAARAEIGTPAEAARYVELGVRHFCIGYDLGAMRCAVRDGAGALRTSLKDAVP